MFRQRAPWWMYLLAASYTGCAAVGVYVEFRGPEEPGIELTTLLAPGPATARAVAPGSPAARAGIEPGDRMVAANGRDITSSLYWVYALTDARVGRPIRVSVERGGQRREVILTLGQKSGWEISVLCWVRLLRSLLALSLAIVIAFSRPFQLQARLGALLLADIGVLGFAFLHPLSGVTGVTHGLPLALRLLLGAPFWSPGALLLFAFAANFPRPLFIGVWNW